MTIKDAAARYIAHGYSPIPLSGKRPIVPGWTKFAEKQIDDLQIFNTATGIGLVCGFNGLEVVDVDTKHHDGDEWIQFCRLVDDNTDALLDKLVIANTPSGGVHLLYQCDEIAPNQKLAKNKRGEVTFETRGMGGQIAAFPSPGYKYETKRAIQRITPEERAILLDCARAMDQSPSTEIIAAVRQTMAAQLPGDSVRPGDDYASKVSALEILSKHGWTIGRHIKDHILVKRPGDTKAESSGKVFVESGLFYCWTTSTVFEAERAYNSFAIYAILEHGGDFHTAAKTLGGLGFGERKKSDLDDEQLFAIKSMSSVYTAPGVDTPPIDVDEPAEPVELTDEEIKARELIDRLLSFEVDSTVVPPKPPVAIELIDTVDRYVLGTLGNFSLVQGKAKSRKSFFVSALAAAGTSIVDVCNKFRGYSSGKCVVYIDTEQGDFHAHRVKSRIHHMAGLAPDANTPLVRYFQLRSAENNKERLMLSQVAIASIQNIGVLILDGVVDLMSKGVNDEEEATEMASRLLKWSAELNCHIICVLHENKNDRNAKGHLGAYLVQKAETVFAVTREEDDTVISAEYTRNKSFPDIKMTIDDDGRPAFELVTPQPTAKRKALTDADLFEIAAAVNGMKKTDARDWVRVNKNTTDAHGRQIIQDIIIKGFVNAVQDDKGRGFTLQLVNFPTNNLKADETPF